MLTKQSFKKLQELQSEESKILSLSELNALFITEIKLAKAESSHGFGSFGRCNFISLCFISGRVLLKKLTSTSQN